jgi:hypothetical protein
LAKRHGYSFHQEPLPEPEEPPLLKGVISEINEKHFLIRNIGGKCMVGEMIPNPAGSGQMLSLQSVEAFRTWHGNQFVTVSDNQGNAKRKPLGAYWLQHRNRRGYNGIDLVPNAPEELPKLTRGCSPVLGPQDRKLVLALLRSANGSPEGRARAKALLAASKRAAEEEYIKRAQQIIRERIPDIDDRVRSSTFSKRERG